MNPYETDTISTQYFTLRQSSVNLKHHGKVWKNKNINKNKIWNCHNLCNFEDVYFTFGLVQRAIHQRVTTITWTRKQEITLRYILYTFHPVGMHVRKLLVGHVLGLFDRDVLGWWENHIYLYIFLNIDLSILVNYY